MIVTQKMFGYCGRLRAVSLFVNRSAMFVEAGQVGRAGKLMGVWLDWVIPPLWVDVMKGRIPRSVS